MQGVLDKANVTSSGDSTSKLNVLTQCESYIRNLQDRTKCYELEARLRSVAHGGHVSPQDGGGAAGGNDIDWAKSADDRLSSEGSRSGETDNLDGASSRKENESSSSSSNNTIRNMARSSCLTGVVRPGSACESGAGSGPEEDGDTGSTDSAEQRSANTTDSGSQGFTTDSASRGFGTDSGYSGSSFGGDSGSGDSGDAGIGDSGSADGGSEGSEEGSSRARMRVANYFDIFRLSNVPMAIADKEGTLLDVNDAMRGFGRINNETVKTLTVRSLVASESSKASDLISCSDRGSSVCVSVARQGYSRRVQARDVTAVYSCRVLCLPPSLRPTQAQRPPLMNVTHDSRVAFFHRTFPIQTFCANIFCVSYCCRAYLVTSSQITHSPNHRFNHRS